MFIAFTHLSPRALLLIQVVTPRMLGFMPFSEVDNRTTVLLAQLGHSGEAASTWRLNRDRAHTVFFLPCANTAEH